MKLRIKLIIAFSSIVILMGIFQSAFFQNRMTINFDDYIHQNETQEVLIWKELLLQNYISYGDWSEVNSLLNFNQQEYTGTRGPKWGNSAVFQNKIEIVVADENGIVIADTEQKWTGIKIEDVLGVHQDLIVNEEKVGELVVVQKSIEGLISLEQEFMASIRNSIIFGMIVSVIIAVMLGIFFSNRITGPLDNLMAGIRRLSSGDMTYRVKVETKDEFHQLATAFNEMSCKIEENEQVRKNLMADVAHELRTPISIIGGELESILEGVTEPNQEVLVKLSDEVYRLNRLINDLQQISLAEAGRLPLNKKETNLYSLVQRVISNFEWAKEDKNINILLEGSEDVVSFIDSDRITQVIINLVGNALHHTSNDGKIIIKVEQSEGKEVKLTVEDNGQGISEEHLKHIFDRFYRTDSGRSRDQGGTGLGLSIAKGYIEAHHGKIIVESEVGKGTKFIISIPFSNN
ncbi:MAG: ATP-binding protein [Vulcanibacillus sp.]